MSIARRVEKSIQKVLGNNQAFGGMLFRHLLDASDFLPLRQRILEARRQAWMGM